MSTTVSPYDATREEESYEAIPSRLHPFGGGEQRQGGALARTIAQRTAKIPSDAFLWAAVGSLCGALILGLYHKMIKLRGSAPA